MMIEVAPRLYVGSQQDYERLDHIQGWCIVHACKEPYHREALGYTSHGAPQQHAEYLFAVRGNRLILNLIDADTPNYIPTAVIAKAIGFINDALKDGRKVLVHCNQGASRAPAIALAYLQTQSEINHTLEQAEAEFRKVYPAYAPKGGVRGWLEANWKKL